jgi:uncharacterized membrane protein
MRDAARHDVARWIDAGAIDRGQAHEALVAAGAIPSPADWRDFLAKALLWLGAVAFAAALGFFIAANWQALGRFGKLALVQAVIVAALAVIAFRGVDSNWGRAGLLVASLGVGTLLALVGQTYQTGADTHELFVAWALAILPWAAVARQPALWLVWIAIVDVAACFFGGLSLDVWRLLFGTRGALWYVVAIHATALLVWEAALARGSAWLDARYAVRFVAAGLGVAATWLVVEAIVSSSPRGAPALAAAAVYCAMLAAFYVRYRLQRVDLFVLAGSVLSAIIVVVALLVEAQFTRGFGGFFATGLVVVALAAVGAHWLRRVAGGTPQPRAASVDVV